MEKKDGLEVTVNDISEINEELNLWKGEIHSSFKVEGIPVEVILPKCGWMVFLRVPSF